MEYYSAVKRNVFESVLMRWMNLEPIIQSSEVKSEQDKYHILTGRNWGQEEKGTTEDEMAGWHHRLDGHEFG